MGGGDHSGLVRGGRVEKSFHLGGGEFSFAYLHEGADDATAHFVEKTLADEVEREPCAAALDLASV